MNSNLVYVVSLALVLNCVISVAKNSEEKVVKTSLNATDETIHQQIQEPQIFAEGGSSFTFTSTSTTKPSTTTVTSTTKNRIVGRKGVDADELITPVTNTTTSQSATSNNVTVNIPTSANSTLSTTTTSSKITTTSTTQKPRSKESSTQKPVTTSATTASTTTTKKPIQKPKITYSADDDPDIIASEKNINYNATTKMEDITVPKTSQDIDRTIIDDEKRTRNSWAIVMGLVFGIPMTFTLVHVLYKKIKAWREIRHYQRVVS